MCTYNAISSHTDHFAIQKKDSEESLLTFVNLFARLFREMTWTLCTSTDHKGRFLGLDTSTNL